MTEIRAVSILAFGIDIADGGIFFALINIYLLEQENRIRNVPLNLFRPGVGGGGGEWGGGGGKRILTAATLIVNNF